MAKPFDQVVRDRIAPVAKDAGYTKKGRLFIREDERGDRAVLEARQHRLGQHDAEFFLDVHVQPRIWRDYLTQDGGDTHAGIWSDRLRPPGQRAGGMSDLWSFDLADEASGRVLSEAVAAALPALVRLLDADNLLPLVRAKNAATGRPSATVAALLCTQGPSEELEALLSTLEQEDPDERPGFDMPAYVGFLRAWMADHAPTQR
ncbi:hypothetical protein GCM10009798_13710 [Nocardioides panacihumi]|uniref:DUF4304 domain-containing protein n=1 Tax=Nocardioides panacihumi TaxID=400774 RepID=A0ABP5C0B6_9ACTN